MNATAITIIHFCQLNWTNSFVPDDIVQVTTCWNKKLSCRRETARCFVSLNISLSHSRSLNIIRNDTHECGVSKSLLVFHCN